MKCPDCSSEDLIRRGPKKGFQRYKCRSCGRHSTDKAPKFGAEVKAMALEMYLNNMGIRAIGRVLKASPATILNWIRKDHERVMQQALLARPGAGPDIIEMDEIYTCVQKNSNAS